MFDNILIITLFLPAYQAPKCTSLCGKQLCLDLQFHTLFNNDLILTCKVREVHTGLASSKGKLI